jgi:hypothetical protein
LKSRRGLQGGLQKKFWREIGKCGEEELTEILRHLIASFVLERERDHYFIYSE